MKGLDLKDHIIALYDEGRSYEEIAEATKTPAKQIRTICSRENKKRSPECPEDVCRCCGKPLCYTPHRQKKHFCDKKCRDAFYDRQRQNKAHLAVCEACGLEFVYFGKYPHHFCSKECRMTARRQK